MLKTNPRNRAFFLVVLVMLSLVCAAGAAEPVGVNEHLTTPLAWQEEIGWNINISALGADLAELNPNYVFEGMLMAWGRDYKSPTPWDLSDKFVNEVLPGLPGHPHVIGNAVFMPYRVRRHSTGEPVAPVFGIDYFTMFDPLGDDAPFLDEEYQVISGQRFLRNDPRVRPLRLFDVTNSNGETLDYGDLLAMRGASSYPPLYFSTNGRVDEMFFDYVTKTVRQYWPAVETWHFGNEPNGEWYVDPSLYARMLYRFAEMVHAATPSARVMSASLARDDSPAGLWWLDHFGAELERIRLEELAAGRTPRLPMDVAGINLYIDNSQDYARASAAYSQLETLLEDLAQIWGTATPPIVIKEHSSYDPDSAVPFLQGLGAEAVLWFHHFAEHPRRLVQNEAQPATSRTLYWYWVRDNNSESCVPQPVADAGPDRAIVPGGSVQIGTTAQAGVSYSWSPTSGLSNPGVARPIASPATTTTYTVTTTNACGQDTDSVVVSVVEPGTLTILTPNGGENFKYGDPMPIQWTWTGNPATQVRVELQWYGIWSTDIAFTNAGAGSVSWTTPWVQESCEYTVRIVTLNASPVEWDTSDQPFCIQDGSAPPPGNTLDFRDFTIQGYGGRGQAGTPTVKVEDGGATLHIVGNGWRKISFPWTVTADTVLEFDFKSGSQGEIHGLGFDIHDALSANRLFKVYGTQAWGILDHDDYTGSAPNWKHYRIPVGQYFTGSQLYLTFANDHDGGGADGEGYYSNVRVYEADQAVADFDGNAKSE